MDDDNRGRGSGRFPTQPSGGRDDFFLGELHGKVKGIASQFSDFRSEQSSRDRKIFDKLDELKDGQHPAPCAPLQNACNQLASLKVKHETNETQLTKVKEKVNNLTSAGGGAWKTITVVAAITAFLLGSIGIPFLVAYLTK